MLSGSYGAAVSLIQIVLEQMHLAKRVTALWESFDVELNFRRSARDRTYLQYATTKVSSDSVWITAIIPPAGTINHLMGDEDQCGGDEAFRDVDRAPATMGGSV